MRVEWRVGWDELSCGLAGATGFSVTTSGWEYLTV